MRRGRSPLRHAVIVGALAASAVAAAGALGPVPVTQVSADAYTNPTSQHRTQVEPDTYSFGSTIVAVFQSGRFSSAGASNIGWATTTDNGATWNHGFLPKITKFEGGPFDRANDPAVTYDRKHDAWLISTLAMNEIDGAVGVAVLTSRSTDGGLTWGDPVTVSSTDGNYDKNWIVCDNTPSSRFYGRCYTHWTDAAAGPRILMSTSTDGGLTWGPKKTTKDVASGLGGQPLVKPSGVVIVPYSANYESIRSFRSLDGGVSWTKTVMVASVTDHTVAGGARTPPFPSAGIDKSGKVFVAWQDCRFRSRCASNDIVMSTTRDGRSWSPVTRIPIDPRGSNVDHFVPGLGVDPATGGSDARLGLLYHFYPRARCTLGNCRLHVGFVSSTDGGASWSAPTTLAGPMQLSWLPRSFGRMFGDYTSTSFGSDGKAYPVFPIAKAPTGGAFDQAMYAPTNGLELGPATTRVIRTP